MSRSPHDDAPLVSIVMRTCRGRGELLAQAVASVAAQTYGPIELLVVEDGSAEAARVLDGIAADFGREGSGRIVRHLPQAKIGRCRAGNAGLEAATGTLAMFLDDDDQLYPHHLSVLVPPLVADPGLPAACAWAEEVPTVIESLSPLRLVERSRSVPRRTTFTRAALEQRNLVAIQSVLFRRSLFAERGGFRPELDCLEDWDLWLRYSADRDFLTVPEVTSWYRVPGTADEARRRQMRFDTYRAQVGGGTIDGLPSESGDRPGSSAGPHGLSKWKRGLRRLVLHSPVLYGLIWHGRQQMRQWRIVR